MRFCRSGRFGSHCLDLIEPLPKRGNSCDEVFTAFPERPRQDRVKWVSLIENPHPFLLGANFDTEYLDGSFKIDDHGSDHGGLS